MNVARGKKAAAVLASEATMQERVNVAKGEASAIEAHAVASAAAVRVLAAAIRSDGGADACSLRIAEQYVSAFKAIGASGGTVVVPANAGDVGGMVAQAMAVYRATAKNTRGALGGGGPAGAPPAFDPLDALGSSMPPPSAADAGFGATPRAEAGLPPSPESDFAPDGVPAK